ncbi:MAG: hypothetical protein K5770_17725 [Lachnospiraceae bacterium]|nr:hypothetical protein [Lachnospiraceae bacterium]
MKQILAGILAIGIGLMTGCGINDGASINIRLTTGAETAESTENEDSSPVPITDQSEVKAINHDYFVANTQTIFDRHESVEFVFLEKDNSISCFMWETKEAVYTEWMGTDENDAEYRFADNRYYYRTHYVQDNTCDLNFGISAGPDPLQLLYVVVDSNGGMGNNEHESITAYREGDSIRVVSEYDEEWSRNFAKENDADYDGGRYVFEFVIDADDYDVTEAVEKMVSDGKEEVLSSVKVNYDTPEPSAATSLRAVFERSSENMMEVKAVFDPGTENELSYSYTIPENLDLRFRAGDKPVVFFDDPDCTTVSHWDRKSDKTFYVFTDPDEELQEKHAELVSNL